MPFLRAVGAFVGGVSGGLAVIVAAFYGFGFLHTIAQLRLLGIDSTIAGYELTLYVERGAGFVVETTWILVVTALAAVPVVAVGYGVVVLLGQLLRRLLRGADLARRWRAFWARLADRLGPPGRWGAALGLYGAFLSLLAYYFVVAAELAASDVLFAATSPEFPEWRLGLLLLALLAAVLLAVLVWRVAAGHRLRPLFVAPFVLVALLFLLLLPHASVVLSPPRLAEIRLTTAELPEDARYRTLYLVNKNAEAFVVWDPEQRRVHWLPMRSVSGAEIGPRRRLAEIAAGRPAPADGPASGREPR
jgi:hypothetical protein